jgi:hypothetical protein
MDLVEAQARGYSARVRHPWETARVDVIGRLIHRYAPLEPEAIVLDVGCGDTFVVEQLASQYRSALFYAVDTAFTEELVAHYRTRLNNPRVRPFPSLEAIDPPLPHPASLILLMDVIEHIADDGAFLRDLRTRPYVDADTRFLVTVPAYQSLFSSHDTFLGHYRRYSNRTLRRRLEQSGLRVLTIGYFFASLLPIRLLQTFREGMFGLKPAQQTTGLVTWGGSEATAALLRRLLNFDANASLFLRKVGLTLPGLSNYAICAKSA